MAGLDVTATQLCDNSLMSFFRKLIFVLTPLFVLGVAQASAQTANEEDLLPVDKAFVVSAKAVDRGAVQLDWKLAEHYYLYRDRIKVTTTDAGVTLAAHELPPGEKKHDEFLGDVEVYHQDFSSVQKFSAASTATQVTLAVRYQGCHEIDPKICFPPHTAKLTIDLPSGSAATNGSGPIAPLLTGGNPNGIALGDAPLPAEQAFVFEAIPSGAHEISARFTMPKGYYLYRDKTSFALSSAADAQLAAPRWPAGVTHEDSSFGKTTVYFDQVDVPLAVTRKGDAAQPLSLSASFQGCRENGICYPVMSRSVNLTLPAGGADGSATGQAQGSEPSIAATGAVAQQARPATAADDNAPQGSLLAALLAALLGGLVLNLMPCVLPVLSLKAISLVEGGESPQAARKHVLFYTAGVLISFAMVGLAVIILRKAGLAYGWGFQLQHPLFVAVLVYVVVAIGLSMSGLFQFGAGLAGAGQQLTTRSGAAGDFFTGVLAVVVASPCTAPFMGSALAFALASSTVAALSIFLALGLGLALPFLLIGFIPGLSRFLPRPGAWMETFKQLLAFPMYLTAVWLIWVLGEQYGVNGVDAVGLILIGVVLLTVGLWWYERSRYDAGGWRMLAVVALLLALPPLYALSGLEQKSSSRAEVSGQTAFNPTKLAELRKSGKPVFVDIGADWCTTCKVNEHAVLATDAFHDLIKRTDTTLMVGDWTNPDPDIEAFLAQFHAVGVPLYVVFRDGDKGQALPTVLTQGIVQAALERK
jgi:thiol:disulfide interchange protein